MKHLMPFDTQFCRQVRNSPPLSVSARLVIPFAIYLLLHFLMLVLSPLALAAESVGSGSRSANPPASGARASVTSGASATSGVSAIVRTDGALVYGQANFDSDVIATLSEGLKVRVSKGTIGTDFGRFHKVRVGPKVGYIADIDVEVEGGSSRPAEKGARKGQRAKKDQAKPEKKERHRRQEPIFFTRWIGILVGQTEYKESINDVNASQGLLIYGLKVTGPDILLEGPVMDLNVALHYGAPTYYDKLSVTKPSGFVLFTDGMLVLPFIQSEKSMVYVSGGPLIVLSNFKVYNSSRPMDLTSIDFGVSLAGGGGIRFDKVALRLEAKYMIEEQSHKSVQVSIQTEF